MSPRWIRRIVIAVFVGGIAGMIVSSIAESTGAALTFGLLTAAAAVALILVTSVAGADAFANAAVDEQAAADVEALVQTMTAEGANEHELRALVRAAVRLGKSMR